MPARLSAAALLQQAVNVSAGFREGTVKKVLTAVPSQLLSLRLPQNRCPHYFPAEEFPNTQNLSKSRKLSTIKTKQTSASNGSLLAG
jgi:hypothetical protein